MVRLVNSGTWQFWGDAPFPPKASCRAHTYLKTRQEKQFCHQRGNGECWKKGLKLRLQQVEVGKSWPRCVLAPKGTLQQQPGLCITTPPHEAQFMQPLWLGKTIVWSTAVVPDLHDALQLIRFNQTDCISSSQRQPQGYYQEIIWYYCWVILPPERLSGLPRHRLKSYVVSRGPQAVLCLVFWENKGAGVTIATHNVVRRG